MAISVTANESALLTVDTDGDTVADPGETLTFSVTITNTSDGGEILTGVQFAQLLSGVTLVPGTINASPRASNDAFSAVGNTLLEVGNATAQTGPQMTVAGSVTGNDSDLLGDTFTISAFDATSANGGTVTMVTSGADMGSFTYISNDGFTGTDTFTYTITDDGMDGIAGNADDLTSTATVTITVTGQVWYVDGNAAGGGDGTSTNPFNTVTLAGAASGASDYVYVQNSAGGAISLDSGEQLIGTGVALVVGGNTLATATANSTIAGNAAGYTVTLGSNNTIAGIDIDNTGGGALTGTGFGTLTVDDVALDASGQALSLTTGAISGLGFNSTDSDGGTNNVNLQSVTGNLNLGGGALSGATSNAVVINGGGGSVDYNGTITHTSNGHAIQVLQKTGGTVEFDGAVTSNTGSDGVFLSTNTGATINFDGGLTINTSSSGTTGFQATTGGTVSVTGGSNTISSGTGAALDLSGVTVGATGLTFATINTTGGANGVLINTVGQAVGSTGIDINGGAIANATNRGVDINAASADITVAATISTTAAGRSVEVTGSGASGGNTILFSGAIDDNGLGINLDNNDQLGGVATINFTGGLDIDSAGANFGFSATNGGTINVTGGGNSIVTTTGKALVVTNTSIGASDITFHDISANGASHAIQLNATGSAGGLHVTGTGTTDGSGGTIQNITTRGIEAINTAELIINNVNLTNANTVNGSSLDLDVSNSNAAIYLSTVTGASFDNIAINGTADNGITGLNVSNFTLNNSTITGAGNAANESGIEFSNLSGTSSIANTDISFSETNTLDIVNTDVNLNLTLNNVTFRDTQRVASAGAANGNGEGGFQFRSFSNIAGTPVTNIDILDSDFLRLRTQGIQIVGEDDSVISVDITNNVIQSDTGEADPAVSIGTGIDINGNDDSAVSFNVIGNTVQSRGGHAINISSFLDADVEGRVNNNIVGVNGTGAAGEGIRFLSQETSHLIAEARNNTITIPNGNTANGSIEAIARLGSSRLDLTLDNNTIDSSSGMVADIHVQAGSSASGETDQIFLHVTNNDVAAGGPTNLMRLRVSDLDGTSDPRIFLHDFVEGGAGLDDDAAATWNAEGNTGVASAANINVSLTGSAAAPSAGVVNVPNNPTPILSAAPPPTPVDESPPAPDTDGGDGSNPGPQTDLDSSGPGTSGPVVVDDGLLSAAELALIVDAAIERWADAGATADQIAAMRAVAVSVSDLGASQLGASIVGTIVVDDNAAGWSWFVDATPGEDGEYAGTGTQLVAVDANGAAGTRVDLLTVIMHELGHQIGLADTFSPDNAAALMYGAINAGVRRLPAAGEADGAVAPTGGSVQFIGAPIVIGTLNPGESLTIQWQATIDAQSNGLIVNPTNSGTVSWTGPSAGSQPTNVVTTVLDTLTLGDLVFLDVNTNGIFDAGDSGVDGVTLSLFVDTGNDGTPDGVAIATATTAGGGLYSFTGLAPGDYIVQVDAANFTGGGALAGRLSTTNAGDPDDNVDNDSNAGALTGGVVNSGTITLSYNNEPTAGPGNDTNTTLDLGFVAPNQAPVNSLGGTIGTGEDAVDAWLSGMSISDPDANAATDDILVTFDVEHGTLGIRTNVVGGIVVGDIVAQDADTITVQATLNEINATLAAANGLTYTPDTNFNGDDTLTVTSNDRGFSGVDPGLTGDATSEEDVDTRTISVSATNDAPTVVGDGTEEAAPIVEDAPTGGQTVSALFSGQYSDAADAQFSLSNPTGSSPGAFSGVAVVANGSSGATGQWQYFDTGLAAWVDVGAVSAASALLIGSGTSIRFDPAQDFEGAAPTLTVHLIDNSLGFGITFGQHEDISAVGATGGTTAYSTATVVLSQTVTSDGTIEGTGGNDIVNGTAGDDYIDVSQGGDDTVNALGGDDRVYFGDAFDGNDVPDGGDGTRDVLILQGNYTLTLGAASLAGFEYLSLQSGSVTRWGDTANNLYDYDITMDEGNAAPGQQLVVNAQSLQVGEDFTFDGSAETDGGRFLVYGGRGVDTLTGGDGNDIFSFEQPRWNATDTIDGGDGMDAVVLSMGSGLNTITFGASQFTSIESVSVNNRFATDPSQIPSYALIMNDGNVAAGGTLIVNGQSLDAVQTFSVDGRAETDGRFRMFGGDGTDTFIGGANDDEMTGGGAADTFVYLSTADSTVALPDQILDFEVGTDTIDLSAIDAIAGGGDDPFSFIGAGAFSNTAGELRAELVGGVWQVSGDVDGVGGADFLILVTATTADPLTAADFIP